MRWKRSIAGLGLALALAGGQALADGPAPLSGYSSYSTSTTAQAAPLVPMPQAGQAAPAAGQAGKAPAGPQTPQIPTTPEGMGAAGQNLEGQNLANQMNAAENTAPGAGEAGTEAGASANPNMLGDFFGVPRTNLSVPPVAHAARGGRRGRGSHAAFLARSIGSDENESSFPYLDPDDGAGLLTYVARSAFKITDDESPLPKDRFFIRYNYFNGIGASTADPAIPREDLHREVIGFEKTFLDGNASIGVRLPFDQVDGDAFSTRDAVGDLTIILKYAFLHDCQTGNVLSGGLAVTVPTGDNFEIPGFPVIHDTLLQPWVGGIYNTGDLYVQAFSSILIPTDSRDVTIWFNDIGVGYYVYRCRDQGSTLNFIAPTIEAHITTPLNHRGALGPLDGSDLTLPDIVDLTYGATFGLCNRATLALGFVTPMTGPQPFNYEAQAFLNILF